MEGRPGPAHRGGLDGAALFAGASRILKAERAVSAVQGPSVHVRRNDSKIVFKTQCSRILRMSTLQNIIGFRGSEV